MSHKIITISKYDERNIFNKLFYYLDNGLDRIGPNYNSIIGMRFKRAIEDISIFLYYEEIFININISDNNGGTISLSNNYNHVNEFLSSTIGIITLSNKGNNPLEEIDDSVVDYDYYTLLGKICGKYKLKVSYSMSQLSFNGVITFKNKGSNGISIQKSFKSIQCPIKSGITEVLNMLK